MPYGASEKSGKKGVNHSFISYCTQKGLNILVAGDKGPKLTLRKAT